MATVPIPQGAQLVPLNQGGSVPIPQGAQLVPLNQSASQPQGDYLSKTEDLIGNFETGATKGLGQTVSTVSKGLSKLPFVGKYLAPQEGINAFDAYTKPQNLGENLGAGYEQALEMMGTGGPLKAGAEMVASKLPFLGRLAAPALRVGAEALNTGGNAALHGQPVGQSAAIGGGGAAVSEALPFLAPYLDKSATAQYSKVLAPTTKENKAITERVVPELLDRRVTALTQGGLANKVDAAKDAAGQAVDAAQGAIANQPVSLNPILDHLEDVKNSFIVDGQVINPQAVSNIDKVQGILSGLGDQVSGQSLRRVRQILDDQISAGKGFYGKTLQEGSMLDAQKEAADAIRREFAAASPDIARVNAEYSLWANVSKVLGDTAERRTGQFGQLGNVIAEGAGIAGGAAKGGLTGAATGGLMMGAVKKAMQSTAWRTTSAVTKSRLADAIASGSIQDVNALVTRIVAGQAASASASSGQ